MAKDKIKDAQDAFSKYWDGLKTIFMNFQDEEHTDKNTGLTMDVSGRYKIVSRPIRFGKIIFKIGHQNGEMRIFDANNKPYFLPFADGKETEGAVENYWKDIFISLIDSPTVIADFTQFYLEVFDGVTNNAVKKM